MTAQKALLHGCKVGAGTYSRNRIKETVKQFNKLFYTILQIYSKICHNFDLDYPFDANH